MSIHSNLWRAGAFCKFSMNLPSVWSTQDMREGDVVWAVQFGLSEPIPVSSTPSKEPLTAHAVMVKGNRASVNTWGRNRRSPGNPARPSAQSIMLPQAHSAPLSPLLAPVGYFVLLQVLDSLHTFVLTQPVTVLVWLQQQSIPDLQTAPKLASQAGGWLAALTLWNLHTPGITSNVSVEWWKVKCFNFTAINRNIHYSTVYSGVNRIKPNAAC